MTPLWFTKWKTGHWYCIGYVNYVPINISPALNFSPFFLVIMYYNINGDLYVYILPDQLNIQCYNLQEIYQRPPLFLCFVWLAGCAWWPFRVSLRLSDHPDSQRLDSIATLFFGLTTSGSTTFGCLIFLWCVPVGKVLLMVYIQRFLYSLCFQIRVNAGCFGGWKERDSTKGAGCVFREPVVDTIDMEGMATRRYSLKPLIWLIVC